MNPETTTLPVPILMVDDRPENLLSLEQLLLEQGYELVKALSGNEALRLILRQDFALVLMDVQMPEMDGFETAELMRANPKTRHIPIIFVTAGLKELHFQFKGYDAGAVDYLTKPIEPLFLQSKVRIFADLYRQRREIELHKNHLEELVEQRTEELQLRNREMKAVEELLRRRITEFIETHDQLLATEEMLRVQIEEYEVGQKLLNESNRNLQTLFDVSPLAIVVSSFPSGKIREINHTFTDDFGYDEQFVIGKTGNDIGLWLDNEERDRFLKLMNDQQGVSGYATEIKTFQGESRNVLLHSNLIDYKGERCLVIVFMDVTEQMRMEDQIRQTQKMEVIGQLAGGVAHDFNNMLTAITGSAELLMRHINNNPNALKLLSNIQQAAVRSADLTGQLLAFSRKGQKDLVPVCIETAIKEVISLLERTIDKKITLVTQFAAKNTCVNGDTALLQNALLNLGVNARDAMPEGGVITFTTANIDILPSMCGFSGLSVSAGPGIEISVSDTGVGMTKEIIQRIFEPFFTTKGVGKGTGLGLAAVYGTITDHRGCIDVVSEPGAGTVFKIYLPLSQEKKLETVLSRDALITGTGGVLLVDDEEILRFIGRALLEELGYQVFLAEDGEQALEVFEQEKGHISLVILDMQMPRMGGRETLLRLKEKYPDVRVLIASGFHQDGTLEELKTIGARGFLQKPFKTQELSVAVAEAMG